MLRSQRQKRAVEKLERNLFPISFLFFFVSVALIIVFTLPRVVTLFGVPIENPALQKPREDEESMISQGGVSAFPASSFTSIYPIFAKSKSGSVLSTFEIFRKLLPYTSLSTGTSSFLSVYKPPMSQQTSSIIIAVDFEDVQMFPFLASFAHSLLKRAQAKYISSDVVFMVVEDYLELAHELVHPTQRFAGLFPTVIRGVIHLASAHRLLRVDSGNRIANSTVLINTDSYFGYSSQLDLVLMASSRLSAARLSYVVQHGDIVSHLWKTLSRIPVVVDRRDPMVLRLQNIQVVSETFHTYGNSVSTLADIGKSLELQIRSLSNLDEQLHHSYTHYVFDSQTLYCLSLAAFPVVGLFAASACCLAAFVMHTRTKESMMMASIRQAAHSSNTRPSVSDAFTLDAEVQILRWRMYGQAMKRMGWICAFACTFALVPDMDLLFAVPFYLLLQGAFYRGSRSFGVHAHSSVNALLTVYYVLSTFFAMLFLFEHVGLSFFCAIGQAAMFPFLESTAKFITRSRQFRIVQSSAEVLSKKTDGDPTPSSTGLQIVEDASSRRSSLLSLMAYAMSLVFFAVTLFLVIIPLNVWVPFLFPGAAIHPAAPVVLLVRSWSVLLHFIFSMFMFCLSAPTSSPTLSF
eukprot:ANDGO_06718.mRNA.1 hypothetical protein